MSTTTIRLPDDLKARLSKIAEKLGSSSHALIIDAISERVEAEERRGDFIEIAEQRFAKLAESGETIPWKDMKAYLQARATGAEVRRPKPRKLTR